MNELKFLDVTDYFLLLNAEIDPPKAKVKDCCLALINDLIVLWLVVEDVKDLLVLRAVDDGENVALVLEDALFILVQLFLILRPFEVEVAVFKHVSFHLNHLFLILERQLLLLLLARGTAAAGVID